MQEQFERIRVKLGEKRDGLDAKPAERRVGRAEANAADAIDFASWAVDEAEAEALQAAEARKIAASYSRARASGRVIRRGSGMPDPSCGPT